MTLAHAVPTWPWTRSWQRVDFSRTWDGATNSSAFRTASRLQADDAWLRSGAPSPSRAGISEARVASAFLSGRAPI